MVRNTSFQRVAALLATTITLIGSLAGCRKETPVPARPVNRSYLEIYGLSSEKDADHPIALQLNGNGPTWYRELRPGVDLGDIDLDSAIPQATDGQTCHIFLLIKPARANAIAEWSRPYMGKPLGVLLDGRLVFASDLGSHPLGNAIKISGFTRLDTASAVAARIKAGGFPPGSSTSPSAPSTAPSAPAVP